MPNKKHSTNNQVKKNDAPGISLEKVVARIQQMMDPKSTVAHNKWLEDRVGNKRQYDVVIRGQFGGRPVLGVMECKDHNRKKGPDAVEAFAKKTENLGANLRIIVSKKGFTKQALKLAEHENIGCLSLLPEVPEQVGFSIGDMSYGVIRSWSDIQLMVHFAVTPAPINAFDSSMVKWNGKPVINWFLKELFTTLRDETKVGEHTLQIIFDTQRNLEIDGKEYPVTGLTCVANRTSKNKKKWISWSGDAFYDWHTGQLSVPAKGQLVGSVFETDLSKWDDFDDDIPKVEEGKAQPSIRLIFSTKQIWDTANDDNVPDLLSL